MIKIITNNWQAKIICLLIAVGFWTYVAGNQAKVDNFPGGVPLEINNTPEGMIAITDVEKIDLKIVAERNVWNRLTADYISASVDLANLEQGTHELPINIDTKMSGIEVVDYNPKTALIRLEPKVIKNVPINVKIEGEAAENLMPGISIVEPDKIEISGAKSIIDKILEATAIVRLDGETENVSKSVRLVALNAEGEKITNIKFNPEEVKVTIPIIKAGTTKTVGIKVKTVGSIANGFWISNISTLPSTITITGAASTLRSINYLETREINIDGLNSSTTQTIELNIPSGISITDQITSVKINIELLPTTSSKQVNGQIATQNLGSNLKLNSLDPNSILVNLSGTTSDLEKATSDNVKLNLNLSAYSDGTYSIDITNNMFSVPEGIIITSFIPSAIKVNIVKK